MINETVDNCFNSHSLLSRFVYIIYTTYNKIHESSNYVRHLQYTIYLVLYSNRPVIGIIKYLIDVYLVARERRQHAKCDPLSGMCEREEMLPWDIPPRHPMRAHIHSRTHTPTLTHKHTIQPNIYIFPIHLSARQQKLYLFP